MKDACTDKAKEWEERSEAYTGELNGIKEALKILTSDEAREMFGKAIKPGMETMFLQTRTIKSDSPSQKAYEILKTQAAKAKSMRLASLAAAVRMSKNGK